MNSANRVAKQTQAISAVVNLAALIPLFQEIGDLKRICRAKEKGKLKKLAFDFVWTRFCFAFL